MTRSDGRRHLGENASTGPTVSTRRVKPFPFSGVRLGGGLRVAAERRRESGAVHAVRDADGPPGRGGQPDGVSQTVDDHRSDEAHRVHDDDAFGPV